MVTKIWPELYSTCTGLNAGAPRSKETVPSTDPTVGPYVGHRGGCCFLSARYLDSVVAEEGVGGHEDLALVRRVREVLDVPVGFGVRSLGFRVWGLVGGLRLRVEGLGFRVQGLGVGS